MPRTITIQESTHASWLSRITGALRSYWTGKYSLKDPALGRFLFPDGPPSTAGVFVNESTALNFSAVWAAVSLISSDVASLPLILYRRQSDGGKERAVDHRLYEVLHDQPNSEMSAMTLRETLTAHVLTWGNGYAEIVRDRAGRTAELWPITPDRVVPFRDRLSNGSLGPLRYRIDGSTVMEAADILHIPGLGFDGCLGYGVVAKARESIAMGLAAEKFGSAFYGGGSTFGGVVTHPGELGPEEQDTLRQSIERRHQGIDRAHRILVLEEGATFTPIGIPPEQAQFLQSRQFQVTEIARWFNLPPHKLAEMSRANFSNVEALDLDYFKSCLRKWLVRWEQEINRKLLSRSERRTFFSEHLVEGILRGDHQARGDFYSKLFHIGGITINEIRARENLNPVDGGDKLFVPQNVIALDQVDQLPAPDGRATRALEVPRIDIAILDAEQVKAEREALARQTRQEHQREHMAYESRVRRLERVKREIEDEDRKLKAQQERRLAEWNRRRKQLDKIATRYPALARELRAKGWESRTEPTAEDARVRLLVERIG